MELSCRLFDSGNIECNWTSLKIGLESYPMKAAYGSCYFMLKFGPLYIYSWTNHRWWLNLGACLARRQGAEKGCN